MIRKGNKSGKHSSSKKSKQTSVSKRRKSKSETVSGLVLNNIREIETNLALNDLQLQVYNDQLKHNRSFVSIEPAHQKIIEDVILQYTSNYIPNAKDIDLVLMNVVLRANSDFDRIDKQIPLDPQNPDNTGMETRSELIFANGWQFFYEQLSYDLKTGKQIQHEPIRRVERATVGIFDKEHQIYSVNISNEHIDRHIKWRGATVEYFEYNKNGENPTLRKVTIQNADQNPEIPSI